MAPREIATVIECMFCRSHIVMTVAVMDPAQFEDRPGWRGKPEDKQEEWLVDVQARLEKLAYVSMPCPYCISIETARTWSEWVESGAGDGVDDGMALLYPCKLVAYDPMEDPPLYINQADRTSSKKKWVLCQGVGPQSLELDKTKAKIYKRSYRGSGLTGEFLTSFEIEAADPKKGRDTPSADEVASLRVLVEEVCWGAEASSARALLSALYRHFRPFLNDVATLRSELEAIQADPGHALDAFLATYPVQDLGVGGEDDTAAPTPATVPAQKKTRHSGTPPPTPYSHKNRAQRESRQITKDAVDEYRRTGR